MLYTITLSTRPVVLATIPDTRNHSASFGISATPVNFKPPQLSVGSFGTSYSEIPLTDVLIFSSNRSRSKNLWYFLSPPLAVHGEALGLRSCSAWRFSLRVRYLGLRFALFVGFNPRFFFCCCTFLGPAFFCFLILFPDQVWWNRLFHVGHSEL
jgi:hypothetical protein